MEKQITRKVRFNKVISEDYLNDFFVRIYKNTQDYEVIKSFRSASLQECNDWLDKNIQSTNGYEIFQKINM